MTIRILLIIICCLCSSYAQALLSPLNQSIYQLETLIKQPQLQNSLNASDEILEIRKERDTYFIVTKKVQMLVDIHFLPASRIGPREFEFVFHPPIPKD